MSKTIQDLEAEVSELKERIRGMVKTMREVDDYHDAIVKLTAQKYEAIIEERVQETVKQCLEKPQPGDFVMLAIERKKAELRDSILTDLREAQSHIDSDHLLFAAGCIEEAIEKLQ